MKKELFLLGGHDLEMQTIKELLNKHGRAYKDKALSWGAKLSDYEEELAFDGIIYGIELEQDIESPKNYVEINHHGKNDMKKSSLEQVAEILDIELTRDQELIAANDSRYIDGMKAMCAATEEIDKIRKLDRESQNIPEEAIEQAVASLKMAKDLENFPDNFIYSISTHFTTLSDLAYCKFENYVIYNGSKIVFYGYKKEDVLAFLKSQNILKESYYYGGGECGFVGVKEGMLEKEKIENLIQEFKKKQEIESFFSYHTFMLPFTFDGEFECKDSWKCITFNVTSQRDYNVFNYFYKHVQDVLYNSNEKEWASKYYEYKNQKGTYTINSKKGTFELELDGISLRVFKTNVAILSFNLKNMKHPDLESILAINDFGRRIYPQFLGESFTKETKNSILPDSITLSLDGADPLIENFSYFDTKENLKKQIHLPKFVTELIKDNFTVDDKAKPKIRPIIDDRMFVISQYNNYVLANRMKNFCNDEYEYEKSDSWYKYMFIDGDDKTCQSKHMSKKLIAESTYDRWVELGTLFGVTRYSFVALSGNEYGKNILLAHMQTMYFQMFTLLLAYRATIIKFADKIQEATSKDETIVDESKKVYKEYLDFLNKSFFKEITAQDQGIEIYNKAMKVMDIDRYMSDLDNEINELHSYASIIAENDRNDRLELISKLGAIFLPPSLMAGIFGMNVLVLDESVNNQFIALLYIILAAIIGFVSISKNNIFSKKKVLIVVISVAIYFSSLFYFMDVKESKTSDFKKEIKKCQNTK